MSVHIAPKSLYISIFGALMVLVLLYRATCLGQEGRSHGQAAEKGTFTFSPP